MSDSVTGQYVTLTSDGEQTGRFLPIVQTSVNFINSVPHIDLDSQPITPGTSGGITLTSPNPVQGGGTTATDPYIIEFPPYIGYDDTTPVAEGSGIPASVRDKVYLIPATIPEFTLNGGDDQTTVAAASPLNYNGPASLIDAFGGVSTINATGSNETIAAGGAGGNVITMSGDGDQLYVDSGSNGQYTDVGDGAIWVIGSAGGSAQPTVPSAETDMKVNSKNNISLVDPTAKDFLVLDGTGNTVLATAGNDTISAVQSGNLVQGAGADNLEFVSSAVGNNTVITGSGVDTIFGEGGGVIYYAGSGKDLYVGGTGQSTIVGGTGNQTLFGGVGGDVIYVNGSHDIVVNGGGADNIYGSTGGPGIGAGAPQVTLFGSSGGNTQITGASPALIVAGGSNETINASNSDPGNVFFVNDAASTGNTTLVGSGGSTAEGGFSDLFVVQSVAGGNNAPHTLTIENFHTSDAFFLNGYGPGDQQIFANAVNNDPTPTGNLSVALSDGTTLSFVGSHPTNIFNGGAVAT